jgi:hypothetical protein
VVPLRQGDAVVLAVNHRPVRSARGFYRTNLRHGVSSGENPSFSVNLRFQRRIRKFFKQTA